MPIIRHETACTVNGLNGRAFAVVTDDAGRILNQTMKFSRAIDAHQTIVAELRFDDGCKNGHASFAITGEIRDTRYRGDRAIVTCGCIHDEIAKHFPELAHLIPWHLTSTDGPMHYIANTVYLAPRCAEPGALRAALEARLPALVARFRADMDACGFIWSEGGKVAP